MRRPAEILLGIRAIHAFGFVHRDIKPENIFIDEHGRPVIGDLGLTESVAPTGAIFNPNGRHTPLVESAGTPEYMSPEQWMGREYSFPSDVFAWGVTLFEMLIGRPIWRRCISDDDPIVMAKRTVLGTVPQWLGNHTLPNEETS